MKKKISPESLLMFYELINSGSINKASTDLNMPKSSISRKLNELEEALQCNLVNRGNSGLILTEVGRLLYEKCNSIHSEIDEIRDLVANVNENLVGKLKIKLPTDFWMSWLGDVISEFSLKYSDVKLDIVVSEIPADISVEPYDLSIHIGEIPNLDINQKIIGKLERGFFASPKYLKTLKSSPDPKEIYDFHFIIMNGQLKESIDFNNHIIQLSDLKSPINTNSVGFSLNLANLGHGIALLPKKLCAPHVKSGDLIEVFQECHIAPLMVTAGFIGIKNQSRKIKVFLDMLTDSIN